MCFALLKKNKEKRRKTVRKQEIVYEVIKLNECEVGMPEAEPRAWEHTS